MDLIDLYSGCGGFSQGFAKEGFNVLCSVDNWEDALKTNMSNHKNTHFELSDVYEYINKNKNNKKLIKADILIGGPPCQGFCAINPNRDINDPRNSEIDTFLYGVKTFSPNIVIIENVPGLLSLGKGYALDKIKNIFQELKYEFNIKILQAAHYGVPQNRWRVIIVANKFGKYEFPKPSHKAFLKPNIAGGKLMTFELKDDLFSHSLIEMSTVSDALSDLPIIENGASTNKQYICHPKKDFQKYLRENNSTLNDHECQNLGPKMIERLKHLPDEGMNWMNLPVDLIPKNIAKSQEKWGRNSPTRFGRLRNDSLFTTILTKPEPYWGSFFHPKQDRLISVREAARAQSFQDSYSFFGNKKSKYKQIGNAVPVLLAQNIAKSIKQLF